MNSISSSPLLVDTTAASPALEPGALELVPSEATAPDDDAVEFGVSDGRASPSGRAYVAASGSGLEHVPADEPGFDALDLDASELGEFDLDTDIDTDVGELDDPGRAPVDANAIDSTIRAMLSGVNGRSLSSDPLLFLLQLGAMVAESERTQAATETSEATSRQRTSNEQAGEARRRAAAANRRAGRLLRHAPRWVKRLLKVITVAVGVAAAAFTGGASLGFAIAGAVLMLGAKGFQQLAVELGMDPNKARWIGIACQVVGGSLMAVSGGITSAANSAAATTTTATSTAESVATASATAAAASSAATSTAVSTAEASATVIAQIRHLVSLFESSMAAVEGGRDIGGAVLLERAASATIDAERLGNENDRSNEDLERILDAMQRALASYRDTESRTSDMIDLQHLRSEAILSRLGR